MLDIGQPGPLGATPCEDGVNFALFSMHAERVELCVFSADGRRERHRLELPGRTGDIWHGFLAGAAAGLQYGYRVHGPYAPSDGHRFNPYKLLVDPYARAFAGHFRWHDAHYGFIPGHPDADLSFSTVDNAPWQLRCVVTEPPDRTRAPGRCGVRPAIDASVVYEAHVKGLTQRLPGVDKQARGRYEGIASPALLEHLESLGVDTLELLPVHEFLDDHFLVEKGLHNYWGYNTLGFFAPARRYARADAEEEFVAMAEALHARGLRLWLDVVYNHTLEGNELGPTLCYRGIDNAAYYRLADDRRFYLNDSGTGNTLNAAHPRVLQMIADSLRHFVALGVDGFRFDLASILGRETHGFDRGAGFFDVLAQDPVLSTVSLVAEPWDIGPGGYQLGQYPQGWSEWNDRFRDDVRRFWLGSAGHLPGLARALLGGAELFEWSGRQPDASINFVTAHDGFTLNDLVSYERKHNEANLEDNRDGHDGNHSNNHGIEGPSGKARIRRLRLQQQLNLLATLFVSQGVPMLAAGSELGQSQRGNNNAYCQDSRIGWLQWEARDAGLLTRAVQRLATLRHEQPVLRQRRFLHGRFTSRSTGLADVAWLDSDATPMSEGAWHVGDARFLALLLAVDPGLLMSVRTTRRAPLTASDEDTAPGAVLVLLNTGEAPVRFPLAGDTLPRGRWERLWDSAAHVDGAPFETLALDDTEVVLAAKSVWIGRCYT